MTQVFTRNKVSWHADFSRGRSLAISFDPGGQHPSFFAETGVRSRPLRRGDFVGDISSGGSCNAEVIEFSTHSHGTHTECIGHILPNRQAVIGTIDEAPTLMRLITIAVESLDEGGFIPATALGTLDGFEGSALALRTLPNDADKQWRNYNEAPAFPVLSPDAMKKLCESELMHLLLDTPSADHPESQGLENHAMWWGLYAREKPGVPNATARSITEMIYVPDDIEDGDYWLDLQLAPIVSDAVPSRPVIYPVRRIEIVLRQRSDFRTPPP